MRITDNAANTIVNIMKSKGLNPESTFFDIQVCNGELGICFSQTRSGDIYRFGELTVQVATNVDASQVVIDFAEKDGRKGLIFSGENNVN